MVKKKTITKQNATRYKMTDYKTNKTVKGQDKA